MLGQSLSRVSPRMLSFKKKREGCNKRIKFNFSVLKCPAPHCMQLSSDKDWIKCSSQRHIENDVLQFNFTVCDVAQLSVLVCLFVFNTTYQENRKLVALLNCIQLISVTDKDKVLFPFILLFTLVPQVVFFSIFLSDASWRGGQVQERKISSRRFSVAYFDRHDGFFD